MALIKKKFWRIPLIVICCLGLLVAWLGFGERVLVRLYHIEMDRQDYYNRIQRLAEENDALMEEIERLHNDTDYVEAVARRQLGLIKENEVIYRFDIQLPSESDDSHMPLGSQQKGDGVESKREVGEDGRNKK